MKIVNPTGLCDLTRSDVHGSSKYQNGNVVQRTVANALVHAGCEALDAIGPRDNAIRKHILVGAYKTVVHVLEQQGYLTAAQASDLETLADGL